MLLALIVTPLRAELVFEYQGAPLVHSGGLIGNVFGDQVIGTLTVADTTRVNGFTGSLDSGFAASLGTETLGLKAASAQGSIEFLNGQIVSWTLVSDWFSIGAYGAIPIESSSRGDRIWPITGSPVLGSATASGVGAWRLIQASAETSAVPLPASWALLVGGLSLLAGGMRRGPTQSQRLHDRDG